VRSAVTGKGGVCYQGISIIISVIAQDLERCTSNYLDDVTLRDPEARKKPSKVYLLPKGSWPVRKKIAIILGRRAVLTRWEDMERRKVELTGASRIPDLAYLSFRRRELGAVSPSQEAGV